MAGDRSLITPELQAAVGVRTEPRSFIVDRRTAMRLAEAVEEDPAVIAAGEFAPPFYIAAFEMEMTPESLTGGLEGGILAGDEWELLRPLRWGEQISATGNVADVYERFGGRFGQTLYLRYEWTFVDERGELVARASRIMARFDAEEDQEAP